MRPDAERSIFALPSLARSVEKSATNIRFQSVGSITANCTAMVTRHHGGLALASIRCPLHSNCGSYRDQAIADSRATIHCPIIPDTAQSGFTALLCWWPSTFSRIGLQLLGQDPAYSPNRAVASGTRSWPPCFGRWRKAVGALARLLFTSYRVLNFSSRAHNYSPARDELCAKRIF